MTEISHEALLNRLAQLKAQAEAATPGPWRHVDFSDPEGQPITTEGLEATFMGCGSVISMGQDVMGADIAAPNGDLYPRGGYDPLEDMRHIATWHPGMALAIITAAEETLREHRPDEDDYLWHAGESHPACAGPHLDDAAEDETGDVWWHECPYVLGVASWVMPKEGE